MSAAEQERFEVLFVDDEPRIVDGLRRQLHGRRGNWNMRFATSGDEALRMLESRPASVVVTDMRMPGMDGGTLLRHVHRLYPQTTRIILSGQTEQVELMRDITCIHQYLQKPCDPAALTSAVERTWRLAQSVRSPVLRCAVSKLVALPPADSSHRELMNVLSREESTPAEVAQVIERDPALTAKVLQLVSSAFFGIPRRIDRVRDAVVLLGVQTIRTLATAVRLFDFVKSQFPDPAVDKLWRASVAVGERAESLARQAAAPSPVPQRARLAGTLSLLGRAVLITSVPEQFNQAFNRAERRDGGLLDSERAVFGATQDDLTAYALGIWGLADDLIAAAAHQSQPSALPPSEAVHPGVFVYLARRMWTPLAGLIDEKPARDPAWPFDLSWLDDTQRQEAA
jgi:HD-like signal output (HDOD) protein